MSSPFNLFTIFNALLEEEEDIISSLRIDNVDKKKKRLTFKLDDEEEEMVIIQEADNKVYHGVEELLDMQDVRDMLTPNVDPLLNTLARKIQKDKPWSSEAELTFVEGVYYYLDNGYKYFDDDHHHDENITPGISFEREGDDIVAYKCEMDTKQNVINVTKRPCIVCDTVQQVFDTVLKSNIFKWGGGGTPPKQQLTVY